MVDKELNWEQIQELTENIYSQIKKEHKKYDWVVSINSGGLIPGVILSKMLKAKHAVISINSYKEKKKNPEVKRDLYLSHIGQIKMNDLILVVDNIIRTGDSVKAAIESLKKVDPDAKKIETASLHFNAKSKFKPTFFAAEVDRDDWIDYPWETLVKP